MKDQMVVTLSQPDKYGQYRVRATYSQNEYMDFFNPANEVRRRVFAQNVILAFGWEERPEYVEEIMAAVLQELARLERSNERL